MIELRPVDEANRDLLRALQLKPGQERFVTSVADSMAEALDDPGGRAIQWGLYDGETPVGFVMISDDVDGDDYFPQYLWKLLIDARCQGRGYGRAAVDRVVEYFRTRPGVARVLTSCVVGEGGPLGFYEGYGFVQTGDVVFGGELLLRLDL
jgi:diamine N-acetyltransferase